jgi:hypothetical protein
VSDLQRAIAVAALADAKSPNAGEHVRRAASPPAPWLEPPPLVAQLHAGPARLGSPDGLGAGQQRRPGAANSSAARPVTIRSADIPVDGGRSAPPG